MYASETYVHDRDTGFVKLLDDPFWGNTDSADEE